MACLVHIRLDAPAQDVAYKIQHDIVQTSTWYNFGDTWSEIKGIQEEETHKMFYWRHT